MEDEDRRVFGWFDTDVFSDHLVRPFMLEHFAENDHRLVGSLNPCDDLHRPLLADLIFERLSAAYVADENRIEQLCVWLNVLGAALVRLASSGDPRLAYVPGTRDEDRGRLCLYMLSGTLGERIMLGPYGPYLCYPDDYPGVDLRRAFRKFFGERVFRRENDSPLTGYPDDGKFYLMLDVPEASETGCPCRDFSGIKYLECHGAGIKSP